MMGSPLASRSMLPLPLGNGLAPDLPDRHVHHALVGFHVGPLGLDCNEDTAKGGGIGGHNASGNGHHVAQQVGGTGGGEPHLNAHLLGDGGAISLTGELRGKLQRIGGAELHAGAPCGPHHQGVGPQQACDEVVDVPLHRHGCLGIIDGHQANGALGQHGLGDARQHRRVKRAVERHKDGAVWRPALLELGHGEHIVDQG